MTRLGVALIKGELGAQVDAGQGVRWLVRASHEATVDYPKGLYDYALLHEEGLPPHIFKDHMFMLSLLQDGCKLDDPYCHLQCAKGYEKGLWGLIHSPRDAFEHYLRAAKKQNSEVR
jgi:TPR repeat protein